SFRDLGDGGGLVTRGRVVGDDGEGCHAAFEVSHGAHAASLRRTTDKMPRPALPPLEAHFHHSSHISPHQYCHSTYTTPWKSLSWPRTTFTVRRPVITGRSAPVTIRGAHGHEE